MYGVFLLLLAVFFVRSIYILYLYPTYLLPFRHMPHPPIPPGLWGRITGHFKMVIDQPVMVPHYNWQKEYGRLYYFLFAFSEPRIMCTDPVLVKKIFIDEADKYDRPKLANDNLKYVLGHGLLTAHGDVHARMLSITKPAFAYSKIKMMVPAMEKYGRQMGELWGELIKREEDREADVDVQEQSAWVTFDVILDSGFGANSDTVANMGNKKLGFPHFNTKAPDDNNVDYYQVFGDMLSIFKLSWKAVLPLWAQTYIFSREEMRKLHAARDEFFKLTDSIIRRKKEEIANGEKKGLDEKNANLLHYLMTESASGDTLTDEELRNNCLTFIFAGHETTSGAIMFTLHLLAEHPDIQMRLREELLTYTDEDTPLDYESIDKLPLLNAVCKESLRILSPVPIVPRCANQETTLGGYKIPKGTWVFASPAVAGRHEETWQDPNEFKPDRWMGWSGPAGKERFMYVPFSAGNKMCIGWKFATIELKVVLITLLRKYSVRPVPGVKFDLKIAITLKTKPGMRLLVSEVK